MRISLVLFDRFEGRNELLPLVATRPVGNLRIGAYTLDQKWALAFDAEVSFLSEEYLSSKFPLSLVSEFALIVNAAVLPNIQLIDALKSLKLNQRLIDNNGNWIAFLTSSTTRDEIITAVETADQEEVIFDRTYDRLVYLEDIFLMNAAQIEFDTTLFKGYAKHSFNPNVYIASNTLLPDNIILDCSQGSIIIMEHAHIEAGCIIHGPAVIGAHVRVKSGTVIYPNVSIGENSSICGELNNTVIWGNSAKGHYGYLGCAVLGEGCNLGAGTSNSNLKNDWSEVKLYSYKYNKFRNTGLLKCGVFIGDHSMLGISSKINTGTVIGVGTQIAMSNFIPKFVPDFSWLTDEKSDRYDFSKFMEMMSRKAVLKKERFTTEDREILEYINNKQLN